MLDTAGRLLLRLVKSHIEKAVAMAVGFSTRQYGIWSGGSTSEAIGNVMTSMKIVRRGCQDGLLTTLDIRNAQQSSLEKN